MKIVATIVIAAIQLGCVQSESGRSTSLSFALEELARFGSLDAEGSALTSVAGISVTDSTVLVLESDPPRVAVFDKEGEWLRDIGRAGDGPGEFRNPTHLGVVDGRIWVGDPFGARLEVFADDGTPVESYRWDIPPDSLGERAMPLAFLADGSILAGPRRMIRARTRSRSHYSATKTGEVLAVLYRETVSSRDAFEAQLSERRLIAGLHPLQESPLVAAYPDGSGLVVVERAEPEGASESSFRVQVIASDGGVEIDADVPYTPVPAEGWLDRYVAGIEQDMMDRAGSIDRGFVDAVRQGLTERNFYPPVTDVVAGLDGSIWLRREDVGAGPVTWQVLTRAGEEAGTLSTTSDLELLLVSLREVWAVELDDFDVPYVVRMRTVR